VSSSLVGYGSLCRHVSPQWFFMFVLGLCWISDAMEVMLVSERAPLCGGLRALLCAV
jgi:hypothetical protein